MIRCQGGPEKNSKPTWKLGYMWKVTENMGNSWRVQSILNVWSFEFIYEDANVKMYRQVLELDYIVFVKKKKKLLLNNKSSLSSKK